MAVNTIPAACEMRHKGVKLSLVKWAGGSMLAFIAVIIGINTCFYNANAECMAEYESRLRASISEHEIRLRASEQNAAATVVELRTIRAQLNRIETQMGARACATPTKETGL